MIYVGNHLFLTPHLTPLKVASNFAQPIYIQLGSLAYKEKQMCFFSDLMNTPRKKNAFHICLT